MSSRNLRAEWVTSHSLVSHLMNLCWVTAAFWAAWWELVREPELMLPAWGRRWRTTGGQARSLEWHWGSRGEAAGSFRGRKCQAVFCWEEEVDSNLEPPLEVESNHTTQPHHRVGGNGQRRGEGRGGGRKGQLLCGPGHLEEERKPERGSIPGEMSVHRDKQVTWLRRAEMGGLFSKAHQGSLWTFTTGLVNGWQVGSIDVKVTGRRILRQESVAVTSWKKDDCKEVRLESLSQEGIESLGEKESLNKGIYMNSWQKWHLCSNS